MSDDQPAAQKPKGPGIGFVPLAGVGGDHDHEGLVPLAFAAFYLLQDQKTATFGEHHVQNDQIGRFIQGQIDRSVAVISD